MVRNRNILGIYSMIKTMIFWLIFGMDTNNYDWNLFFENHKQSCLKFKKTETWKVLLRFLYVYYPFCWFRFVFFYRILVHSGFFNILWRLIYLQIKLNTWTSIMEARNVNTFPIIYFVLIVKQVAITYQKNGLVLVIAYVSPVL